ncbi:MAG: serine/threonine protein kinase [Cytophagaceae bacterium]|nr:serine/threonine protein kinase [Gemmatimonadaceae bacterium]
MDSDLREELQEALSPAYTLEGELPGGGMSRVFVATETALGRRIVVKVLPPDMAGSCNVERFRREIQLAASLLHPHIIPLLSSGEAGGTPYYTMPFVEGESLRSRLFRDHRLPIEEALRLTREVAMALDYAHRRGVIHRDVKPDNILMH